MSGSHNQCGLARDRLWNWATSESEESDIKSLTRKCQSLCPYQAQVESQLEADERSLFAAKERVARLEGKTNYGPDDDSEDESSEGTFTETAKGISPRSRQTSGGSCLAVNRTLR